jgi:hypothetical protein
LKAVKQSPQISRQVFVFLDIAEEPQKSDLACGRGVSMKVFFFVLSLSISAMAASVHQPWHLPLDLTSREYQKLNAQKTPLARTFEETEPPSENDQLMQKIIQVGTRNLQWVDAINKTRPQEQWILLTTPETQHAYPIESPSIYNGEIVAKKYNDNMALIDRNVAAILTGNGELPTQPPVSDEEFTKTARAIDGSYQMASRWLLMKPYLAELSLEKKSDVRGFYFLSKMADREAKLRGYSILSTDEQKQIRAWLIEMCFNSESDEAACAQKIDQEISAGHDLNAYYSAYEGRSHANYDSYFQIPVEAYRSNISWKDEQGVSTFTIPFLDPGIARVLSFVKDNVEAEWTQKAPAWALKINVVTENADGHTPYVEFQSGVTPHVNSLGGDVITMDQNVSLDDYGNNWTIRHEFGHVLGFPDCYLEFYDSNQGVIINYQLDVNNVMCSRRGHIQERHFQELSRIYAHGS